MQGTVLQLQCHFRQKNSTPLRSHFHISLGVQSFLWIFHPNDHHSKKQLSPTNSTVSMDKTAYSGKLLQTFTPLTEQFVLKIPQKTVPKSWDFEPIPIKLQYKNLDVLLPIITNINTSLASSLYHQTSKLLLSNPCSINLPLTKMYWTTTVQSQTYHFCPKFLKRSFYTNSLYTSKKTTSAMLSSQPTVQDTAPRPHSYTL